MATSTPPASLFDVHPFHPEYFPAVIRNLLTMSPGILPVLMLISIIRRRPSMYKQYKLTVISLTFGGFALAIPILLFNVFMVIVIPIRPQLLISTLACSLIKQFAAATMNSTFAVSCAISIVRYCLVMYGADFKSIALFLLYLIISAPLYIYFFLAFIVGTISENDECPMFIEIDWTPRPLLYFGYLALIIVVTDYCNIRVLAYLMQHNHGLKKNNLNRLNPAGLRRERDQLHLSIGLLVQSGTVTCTLGSTIIFMLLFSYGVTVPAWLSTITNTLSSLSTFLNPIASAVFIRPFRREILQSLICSRKVVHGVMGSSSRSGILQNVHNKIRPTPTHIVRIPVVNITA